MVVKGIDNGASHKEEFPFLARPELNGVGYYLGNRPAYLVPVLIKL